MKAAYLYPEKVAYAKKNPTRKNAVIPDVKPNYRLIEEWFKAPLAEQCINLDFMLLYDVYCHGAIYGLESEGTEGSYPFGNFFRCRKASFFPIFAPYQKDHLKIDLLDRPNRKKIITAWRRKLMKEFPFSFRRLMTNEYLKLSIDNTQMSHLHWWIAFQPTYLGFQQLMKLGYNRNPEHDTRFQRPDSLISMDATH